MISFEEFEEEFNKLIKNKEIKESEANPNYKEVDLHTFGDQKAGVRVAEILNEFRSTKFRKKSLKFLHFSNRCYQEISSIKDNRVRTHMLNIIHTERKRTLHNIDLPPVLRDHMYAYIVGRYRNVLRMK